MITRLVNLLHTDWLMEVAPWALLGALALAVVSLVLVVAGRAPRMLLVAAVGVQALAGVVALCLIERMRWGTKKNGDDNAGSRTLVD